MLILHDLQAYAGIQCNISLKLLIEYYPWTILSKVSGKSYNVL